MERERERQRERKRGKERERSIYVYRKIRRDIIQADRLMDGRT